MSDPFEKHITVEQLLNCLDRFKEPVPLGQDYIVTVKIPLQRGGYYQVAVTREDACRLAAQALRKRMDKDAPA
jgi:hypothetical protein